MATLYTIGHGARSAGELVAILKEAGVGTLVEEAGMRYVWKGKALGGMRPSYAGPMQTSEFQTAARSSPTGWWPMATASSIFSIWASGAIIPRGCSENAPSRAAAVAA